MKIKHLGETYTDEDLKEGLLMNCKHNFLKLSKRTDGPNIKPKTQ